MKRKNNGSDCLRKKQTDNLSVYGIMKGNSFLSASRGGLLTLMWLVDGSKLMGVWVSWPKKKKKQPSNVVHMYRLYRSIGLFHHDFSPKKRGLKMWSWSWLRASKTTIGWPRIRKFCGCGAQGFQYKTMIFTDFLRSIFATKKAKRFLTFHWILVGKKGSL